MFKDWTLYKVFSEIIYPFPLEQLNIDPNSAILLLANVS